MNHRYARIVGVGGHLPERAVSNDELSETVDTSDEWIRTRSGIRQRHLADDTARGGDFALPAAQKALAMAQVRGEDLDAIIFATTTPDRIYPATACLLQAQLGAAPCAAFDIQAVCSGFLYALNVAEAMVVAGRARRVLVVGAEVYSHILDWQERATCVLFGDGAGAAVVVASNTPGIVRTCMHADGNYADSLTVNAHVVNGKLVGDPYTRMAGAVVYRFAVQKMTEAAQSVLRGDTPDWLVLHQANLRIINAVRENLQVPQDRSLTTVAEHGNTSAASIPLALSVHADRFAAGDGVLLAAVGGGFTWGATYLKW